jgi:hypothetical protein
MYCSARDRVSKRRWAAGSRSRNGHSPVAAWGRGSDPSDPAPPRVTDSSRCRCRAPCSAGAPLAPIACKRRAGGGEGGGGGCVARGCGRVWGVGGSVQGNARAAPQLPPHTKTTAAQAPGKHARPRGKHQSGCCASGQPRPPLPPPLTLPTPGTTAPTPHLAAGARQRGGRVGQTALVRGPRGAQQGEERGVAGGQQRGPGSRCRGSRRSGIRQGHLGRRQHAPRKVLRRWVPTHGRKGGCGRKVAGGGDEGGGGGGGGGGMEASERADGEGRTPTHEARHPQ